ncbi:hypothetical protein OB919_09435 [Halobacteria archaeon AArc-curdl1]|uniref:Uncharacterized protein n=1 Tax=Natronosalvus hydrolyticus TaxID=2979988 RepID=A0AAP2Z7M1_9EURY|nr:hypothetical protein [Halobacteria archaeon AArc-curdl1]
MGTSLDRTLFLTLFREEWRLHTRLFGGRRFLLFPLVIATLVAVGSYAMSETGYSAETIRTGLHVAVLAFGLYSGSAAFVGSDMLENIFGEITPVLGTSSTLPIARRRLLGHFLLKDVLFYAVVFVLPLSTAAIALEGIDALVAWRVVTTWLSLSLVFLIGGTLTLTLIALGTRGVSKRWFALGGLVAGTGLLHFGVDGSHLSWLVFVDGPVWIGGGVAGLTVFVALGALRLYDPMAAGNTRSVSGGATWVERVPGSSDPLVRKTLLDLARSSGGLWKPIVSAVILFGMIVALETIVRSIVGVEPAPGIFFGGILGLTAFTTYNWLTQFDSVESYLAYPVSVEDVFRAKRVAFYLVGGPTMFAPYLVAVRWYGVGPLETIVGALLLGGFSLYYYGVTVSIAGFDPNEFLFDAVRFLVFTLAVAVVLVPALVVGFVFSPRNPQVVGGLITSGVLAGTIGVWLALRSGPRWADRYRRG